MDDLDKLDKYLSSDESPNECMGLSDFDGFLHGMVCTPDPIDDWAEIAFGEPSEVPDSIIDIAIARLEEIRKTLSAQSGPAEPIFWQAPEGHVIAMDWCEGFMEAVKHRPETWDVFSSTPNGSKLMLPILVHLLDDNGNSLFNIAQEDLDETLEVAADAIPGLVPALYREIRNLVQQ